MMGKESDIHVQFEQALIDGKIEGHQELLAALRRTPEDLLFALSNFAWEAGYDEATGPYGYAPTEVPTPEEIKRFRLKADLDREQAAQLIYYTEQTWNLWEAGKSAMPLHAWELFRIKLADPFVTTLESSSVPAPDGIKSRREDAQISMEAAARMVYCSLNAWQLWEAGKRRMKRSYWELFLTKINAPKSIAI